MKIFKRTVMISVVLLLLLQVASLAVTKPAEDTHETDYNIISKKDQEKIKEFVTIKDGYEKFCIAEGIALLVVLILIIKTHSIEASTKTVALIAVLAIASYIVQFSVDGNIIPVLEVFVQMLGIILFALSAFFIYKNDNLLIYIPIYSLSIVYAVREIQFVYDNIVVEILLILAPVVLLILGKIVGVGKEKALLIPVKEKHEKKEE